MESGEGAKTMNPRASIDNRLSLIQEDLDGVEKRLVVIIRELLGSRPVSEDRVLKKEEVKASKAGGWLNLVVSRLSEFRDQLGRIKGLERDLKNSVIDSPTNMPEERGEPMEGQ